MRKRSGINIGTKPKMTFSDAGSLGERRSVILVADDDPLIRSVVTVLLQGAGYFVLSADDGYEGLELSRKHAGRIDLLITDMNMPGMDGLDLCVHLKEERPGIKLLVMSGADMREIMHNATIPFLPKPFDGETLKARVRKILGAPALSEVHPETLGPSRVSPSQPD